ncbi:MAG: hypothetical protein ACYC9L_14930, partial [Sulfuricaulis sp.]
GQWVFWLNPVSVFAPVHRLIRFWCSMYRYLEGVLIHTIIRIPFFFWHDAGWRMPFVIEIFL